jgi:cytochrome c556
MVWSLSRKRTEGRKVCFCERINAIDFMIMSKKGKKNKAKSAAPTSKALKLDLELLNQLSKLKIDDIPTSVADVAKVVAAIHARKADFEKRQDKETQANKTRAEEKIKKLQAKSEAIAAGLEEEAAVEV